jgi:hypothetical protein
MVCAREFSLNSPDEMPTLILVIIFVCRSFQPFETSTKLNIADGMFAVFSIFIIQQERICGKGQVNLRLQMGRYIRVMDRKLSLTQIVRAGRGKGGRTDFKSEWICYLKSASLSLL